MSLDFIKRRENSQHIALAKKQQEQINYFIQSKIQNDFTSDYLEQWANRNYATSDHFLTWLKTVLKTENFLSAFKQLRYPLASSMLVNNEIKPQLERVFFAEDSYSDYIVRGKKVDTPTELEVNEYNEILFNALLFRYNDIVICDLKEINTPYRYLLEIDKVVAIESHNGKIEKIAFEAEMYDDTENEIHGYLYIDDKNYIFYNKELTTAINTVPHDLGYCPADYISDSSLNNDCDVVRESIFSYVKPELEEYVILKTLQRMSNINGVLPVATMLQTTEQKADGKDFKGVNVAEPMASNTITSQKAKEGATVKANDSQLQAGTIVKVPVVKNNQNGTIDMDLVKNFINFFYMPVDASEFLNKRVNDVKQLIVSTVVGDYKEQNESAKNELQIGKGYVNKEDVLRRIGKTMSKNRKSTDTKVLGLKYGINSISVDVSSGTKFFLETDLELYKQLKEASNPIERQNILIKISQNRNKFNPSKAQRESLLTKLLPFAYDADFNTALTQMLVDDVTKKLQTQFTYYISLFEAKYGDIIEFYNGIDGSDAERLIATDNILRGLINVNTAVPTA